MYTLYPNSALILLPGQAMSCRSQQVLWLRADVGCIWLTGSGLIDDYWLQTGESVVLEANQHLVLQADQVFSRLDVLPLTQEQKIRRLQAKDTPALWQLWPLRGQLANK